MAHALFLAAGRGGRPRQGRFGDDRRQDEGIRLRRDVIPSCRRIVLKQAAV